jgi:hypothetical protein
MIAIEKNEMGGKSVYVFSEDGLADVPKSHRLLVGRVERLALADPARYLHDLAAKAKRPVLRRWLKMLADCESCFLELHTASNRLFPGFPPEAYFRFSLDNDSAPGIRLRSAETSPSGLDKTISSWSAKTIPSPPPALAEVYELIDGINQCGYGMEGGLLSAADISPVAQTGFWLSETNTVDPETCLLFYDTPCGDMLCFQPPNRAVWYAHEVGELRRAGSLRSLVDRYFRTLIQGDILEYKYE